MLNLLIIRGNALSIAVNSEALGSTMVYLILGILFASGYTMLIKRFRGEFVLSLIDSKAFDEASAKSISDLGIECNSFRRFIIKTKFFFSPDYYVVYGNEEKASEEKEERYYVNEDSIEKLESKYSNSGITFIQLFITIIAFFAVALVIATVVPDILNMFDI